MLNYNTIYDINQVRRRIKRGRYGGYYGNQHSLDGDRLYEFTMAPAAVGYSAENLETLLAVAREYEQDLVIIKPYVVQVAGGTGSGRHELIANRLFSQKWLEEHSGWLDSSYLARPTVEATSRGEVMGFYSYRPCLCLGEHQGVYDVKTGKRLTNRRDIIERMWDLGFAANRGRPLAIARLRWSGPREDLELITQLADQHWHNRSTSEVSKKLVSAFTSINRYAAWPGSW